MTDADDHGFGSDGLTDSERERFAQWYRDATSLNKEQIQKAKQHLSDLRQPILNEAKRLGSSSEDRQEMAEILAEMDALDEPLDDDSESDHAPHPPKVIGSLKGRSGYPDDPDALWVALKYDPSVDPEEIVQLTQILDGKPLHRLHLGVGPGWWRLILDCHGELMRLCPDYEINRIKQKFGGLVYDATIPSQCDDQHQAARDIIDRCERRSRLICEETGYPGVLMEQTGSVATLNPKTAAPEWRVSTHSPLTTPEAIKNCPGAIDRLLNDLFHDAAQEVEARTAEHFTRHREGRNDDTD